MRIYKKVYDYIYQNVYTTIEFIFIRESSTYYNVVFKNKNVIYIYIYIWNSFLLESYEFTNIKNNSLFIVQENTSVYLDEICLAQSERKEKGL